MKRQTLIKNGLFFSGNKDEKASVTDILILEDGRIGKIGVIDIDENVDVVDAKGKWVVPGFIDSHTHYDAELIASPVISKISNCGLSI